VPVPDPSCSIVPRRELKWRLATAVTKPLSRWMERMAADGRCSDHVSLPLIRLGEVAWLGTPCDLGVNVALALKSVLHRAGARFASVGSQCNGYVGYVHLPSDYQRIPEAGFRSLAYYENAMSLSGPHMGTTFVAAVRDHLSARGATQLR